MARKSAPVSEGASLEALPYGSGLQRAGSVMDAAQQVGEKKYGTAILTMTSSLLVDKVGEVSVEAKGLSSVDKLIVRSTFLGLGIFMDALVSKTENKTEDKEAKPAEKKVELPPLSPPPPPKPMQQDNTKTNNN